MGSEAYIRGRLTEVHAGDGIWSTADLRDYRVIERYPLEVKLTNGRELVNTPSPPADGAALAQSLQTLEQLPWQKAEPVQCAHYVLEVLHRVCHDRGLLGDPGSVANPLPGLLAPDYLKYLAAGIDPCHTTPSSALPEAPAWRGGDHTTHFAVIDAQDNAVTATLSVNLPFGAAFTVPGTGMVLNNEMDSFATDTQGASSYGLAGSQANAVAAGKRPLSSMSPSFLESPTDFAAFGTLDDSRIPSMVLISMLQYFDGRPVGQ